MCKYLSERAEIVDNPQFEAVIVKSFFTVHYDDLKLAEKVHLGPFRTQQEASHSNAVVETGHKFGESVLLSPEQVPALKSMMKLHWVPPISNIVERLFSNAKNIRTPLRRGRDVSSPAIWATKISDHFGDNNVAQMSRRLNGQIYSHTPSALNTGTKRSGATCHMAMPQCCYLAKGAKRPSHTTNMLTSSIISVN